MSEFTPPARVDIPTPRPTYAADETQPSRYPAHALPAAPAIPPQRLTHSRMQSWKTCPKKHMLSYEVGLRRVESTRALRFGTVFHEGLDRLASGENVEAVVGRIVQQYLDNEPPQYMSTHNWHTECETACALLRGYAWCWQNDGNQIVATEEGFNVEIVNPETGHPTPSFTFSGKIDKIVRLSDGRLAIMEHKTTSGDINPQSDYWRRLRLDTQISGYMTGAPQILERREILEDVATVIYDVIRKPSIAPRQIPLLDEQGRKVVLDAEGNRPLKKDGEPYQSANAEKGWTLQTRVETAQEFGARLLKDCYDRHEFYFQRMEIARLSSDMEEFAGELWDLQKMIREAQKNDRFPRNTAACLAPYKCEFFDLCCNGWKRDQPVPEGFRVVEDVHPELIQAATE